MRRSTLKNRRLLFVVATLMLVAPSRGLLAQSASEGTEIAAEADDPGPIVGYDRGFFVRAPDAPFELRITARLQARYTAELLEKEPNESAFSIPRARTVFQGRAFTDALRYKLEIDYGRGFVALRDFWVDYRFIPDRLTLRIGQWKRPFSRERITSSGRLEFVDRAIPIGTFRAGRDIGLALHNNYERSPGLEWAVGLFNGTENRANLSGFVEIDPETGDLVIVEGAFSNVPGRFDPALVARVGYNYGGVRGYSEADLEGGPVRFAIGSSAWVDFDTDDDNESFVRLEGDYLLKIEGFSTTGEIFLGWTQQGESFGDQTFDALGAYLQAGYVIADLVQPTVRWAMVDFANSEETIHALTAALSFYFFGHGLKWQSEGTARLVDSEAGARTNWVLRSQFQMAF